LSHLAGCYVFKTINLSRKIKTDKIVSKISSTKTKKKHPKQGVKENKLIQTKIKYKNNTQKDISYEVFPYKIGQVMSFAFREALSRGLLNKEVPFLESANACKLFKTRGHSVIVSNESRPAPVHGVRRFAKEPVILNGKQYWITTQVYKEGLAPLLEYLDQHGMSCNEVLAICQAKKHISKSHLSKKQQTSSFNSFKDYLQKTMCKNSSASYSSSLKDLERILLDAHIISFPLSAETSLNDVVAIRSFISSDASFREYNKIHHHSRSAAWAKFEKYLQCTKEL
jgi:hypothetical protein